MAPIASSLAETRALLLAWRDESEQAAAIAVFESSERSAAKDALRSMWAFVSSWQRDSDARSWVELPRHEKRALFAASPIAQSVGYVELERDMLEVLDAIMQKQQTRVETSSVGHKRLRTSHSVPKRDRPTATKAALERNGFAARLAANAQASQVAGSGRLPPHPVSTNPPATTNGRTRASVEHSPHTRVLMYPTNSPRWSGSTGVRSFVASPRPSADPSKPASLVAPAAPHLCTKQTRAAVGCRGVALDPQLVPVASYPIQSTAAPPADSRASATATQVLGAKWRDILADITQAAAPKQLVDVVDDNDDHALDFDAEAAGLGNLDVNDTQALAADTLERPIDEPWTSNSSTAGEVVPTAPTAGASDSDTLSPSALTTTRAHTDDDNPRVVTTTTDYATTRQSTTLSSASTPTVEDGSSEQGALVGALETQATELHALFTTLQALRQSNAEEKRVVVARLVQERDDKDRELAELSRLGAQIAKEQREWKAERAVLGRECEAAIKHKDWGL